MLADIRVDYVSGTYGLEEVAARDALRQKGGKIMETVRFMGP
jgi:hypothetical protein